MAVAEEMVIEKVEMASRQAVDFGESFVDTLRVETSAALKERVLVAEVAVLRTAARDDDGIGNEIRGATDEVAANRRNAFERATGC